MQKKKKKKNKKKKKKKKEKEKEKKKKKKKKHNDTFLEHSRTIVRIASRRTSNISATTGTSARSMSHHP